MTLTARDRRALLILGGGVVLAAAYALYLFASGGPSAPAAAQADSIPAAEKRLARVRALAATVAGKQQILNQVSSELGQREKGILQADTAAQAQAQLLDIVRRTARGENPPVELGAVEFQPPAKLGDYGEVRVGVPFTCHIEELLNLLADLANRPEAIAVDEMRISAHDAKQKTISVRLLVSAVVLRRLVPDKKGGPRL
jgi:hypothetical protein